MVTTCVKDEDYFTHIEQGQDETLEPEHLAVAAFYCDVYDECDAEVLSEAHELAAELELDPIAHTISVALQPKVWQRLP